MDKSSDYPNIVMSEIQVIIPHMHVKFTFITKEDFGRLFRILCILFQKLCLNLIENEATYKCSH